MKPKPYGFTAIELLAAAALSALMSVAMMGILGSMSAQRKVLLEERTPKTWQTFLATQLQQDLTHSEKLTWRPGEIRLHGFGATDPESGNPVHARAEIVYFVQQMGDTYCLLRSERPLNGLLGQTPRVGLVCVGVSSLELQPLQASEEAIDWDDFGSNSGIKVEDPQTTEAANNPGIEMTVPRRLRIVLGSKGKHEALFDEIISSR